MASNAGPQLSPLQTVVVTVCAVAGAFIGIVATAVLLKGVCPEEYFAILVVIGCGCCFAAGGILGAKLAGVGGLSWGRARKLVLAFTVLPVIAVYLVVGLAVLFAWYKTRCDCPGCWNEGRNEVRYTPDGRPSLLPVTRRYCNEHVDQAPEHLP